MFGNWATGRLNIVIAPTISSTIEITIATMGRLMKNFDIPLSSLRLVSRHERLWVHQRTSTNLLHALDDDAFTRLQPFINNPLVGRPVTYLDGPDGYLVVLAHNSYLIAALKFRNRALWDQKRTLSDVGRGPDSSIPPGAQNVLWVWKSSSDSNRAGCLINLAVRESDEPLMRIGIPVGQDQFERQ